MRKIKPKVDEYYESDGMPRNIESGSGKKKSKKIYPHIRLEHQYFPETKKWEVGKTYKVEMKIKMTGLSISRFSNDSEFDIVGFDGSESKESDDSEDSED